MNKSDDLIRRQDAIEELARWIGYIDEDMILRIQIGLKKLPPEKPERKTGKWYIREYEYFTCSECGEDYWNSCDSTAEAKELLETGGYPNYCPNCGARMEGEEDE